MPATIRIPHVSPLVDVTRPGGAESPPGSTGSGAAMDRKIRRRRWPPRRIAGVAAAALFAAFAAWGFLKDSGVRKLNVDRDRVTISEVVHGPFQEYTPVRGTVLPIRTVYLDALQSGQVQRQEQPGRLLRRPHPLQILDESIVRPRDFLQQIKQMPHGTTSRPRGSRRVRR